MDETDTAGVGSGQADQKDLATFGYKQELHRTLGFFSSFAAAFSYISPSTGIFTLFYLGLITVGGVFTEFRQPSYWINVAAEEDLIHPRRPELFPQIRRGLLTPCMSCRIILVPTKLQIRVLELVVGV